MKITTSSLLLIITIMISVVLSSCNSGQNNSHESDETLAVDTKQESIDIQLYDTNLGENEVQIILTSYLSIKEALVQTDGNAASKAAKSLLGSIDSLEDDLVNKIRFDVEHISETTDPEHQRDHFNTLSNHVYSAIKAVNPSANALYLQFCPMAMDNKGAYWVSGEKEVNNPYFGDKMLHCGVVKEEI